MVANKPMANAPRRATTIRSSIKVKALLIEYLYLGTVKSKKFEIYITIINTI
jgi:hypothetical protein